MDFVGVVGTPGLLDGTGAAAVPPANGVARIGGWCTLTSLNDALWVGDSTNTQHAVIRRVDVVTGEVVTVAGGYPSGVGDVDDADGSNARFAFIESLTTDGSTVWIADGSNKKLKAMSITAPYAVTTVAGSGLDTHTDGNGTAAAFDDIRGVTYYGGFVYLLDGTSATLRRFDPATGDVTTIAGSPYQLGSTDGNGSAARFQSPRYMTSDNSGRLFIADTNGQTIRVYNVNTGDVSTFAGSPQAQPEYLDGVGAAARIHRPRGLTSDGTSIYIAEFAQHTIRQGVIATQSVTTNVGQSCSGTMPCNGGHANGQQIQNTLLDAPVGLAFNAPTNTVFVCDSGNNVIRALR
jgi:hypothetical protein